MRKSKGAKRSSPKTCKEITELIGDYLADRLAPRLKREFESHLSLCPDCVNFFKTYKKTVALSAALQPSVLPPRVRQNVVEFLRKKMRRIAGFLLLLAGQLSA